MAKEFSLFVVSDLHAFSARDRFRGLEPSALKVANGKGLLEDEKNPAASLIQLVRRDVIRADYLVCCGDLTDKADPNGLVAAWNFLQELKRALGARDVIATIGNHDVCSRMPIRSGFSHPFDNLKDLEPSFPFATEQNFNRFWARNHVLQTTRRARFLVLNTCATHGYADEYLHGRVSEWTLKQLRKALKSSKASRFNICVCHHHPHKHEELLLGDYDEIKHGQLLLEALEEHGSWLILHGHKHHPKLIYAQGGMRSPVVFSVGSLSASMTGTLQGKIRNQCYRVVLSKGDKGNEPLCGHFRAWTWALGDDWSLRPNYNPLPCEGGFGCRDQAPLLTKAVKYVRKKTLVDWNELLAHLPSIRHLVPADFENFLSSLKDEGIRIEREGSLPSQFQS
jgi:predicted MPP superfamily phosphohydrolase